MYNQIGGSTMKKLSIKTGVRPPIIVD